MHCLPSNMGVLIVSMCSRRVSRACTPGDYGEVSGRGFVKVPSGLQQSRLSMQMVYP